jgi:hypothetical protein
VPVTVKFEVPDAAPEEFIKVNWDVWAPEIEVGLKVPVTPEGSPETPRATVPLKPF